MSEDPEEKGLVGRLIEHVREIIDMRLRYFKLMAYEKSARLVAFLLTAIILLSLAVGFYFSLNLALGFWLAECFESNFYGFLTLAGINLFLVLFVFVFRKQIIINPLINNVVKHLSNPAEDEEKK